jgi:hypothetical protein
MGNSGSELAVDAKLSFYSILARGRNKPTGKEKKDRRQGAA